MAANPRRGRLPINLQRKVDEFESRAMSAELQSVVNNLSLSIRAKRAAMHAQEKSARSRTTPQPASSSTEVITAIEQSGARPAQELSPRLRKPKIRLQFGGAVSKQRTETGAVARFNRR